MAPVRLLLVDDDDSILSGLGAILDAHDFAVTTANNVVDALRLITTESFDVLLSDLHMPGAGDGLIVVGAMRHANPRAVTLLLSANPDMTKATTAMLRQADEVLMKPVRPLPLVELIRKRLADDEQMPRTQTVDAIATVLERERSAIAAEWSRKMAEAGAFANSGLSQAEQAGHLAEAMTEILYRLRYPQPLGRMTLFSMASLQHGARRRRQGLSSPVLVQEARALQVALFEAIERNIERIDLGQLPVTLEAIADEVNAQLVQALEGYENEKPAQFTEE
ncbi:MAG TPA: response regulator [Acidobacteriaceae bacterium]|nr:response regulator [Acidobacteriaceae bacterium]